MKTHNLKLTITLTLMLAFMNGFSQDVLWKKNFGGNNTDIYQSVVAVPDGYVAVGWSNAASFNNGDWINVAGKGLEDAIIVKYDKNGNVVWRKNFGGSDNDRFYSVIAVSDGIVVAGKCGAFNSGDWVGTTGKGYDDAVIVKFNFYGDVVWKNYFGGDWSDCFYSVTAVSDGFAAVGYSNGSSFSSGDWTGTSGRGEDDAIIVKYSTTGAFVWKNRFGGNGTDYYYSVTAVSDGVIAVGTSAVFGNGDWSGITGKGLDDAIIVKYDNSGTVAWKKNFGGNDTDIFRSVTAVSDGFVATGDSYSCGNGDLATLTAKGSCDAITVKFNSSGNAVWKKNFGGNAQDYSYAVTAVSDGIVTAGNSYAGSFGNGDLNEITGKGNADIVIIKYDDNGDFVWVKSFGGNNLDYCFSVAKATNGIVIAGQSAAASFNNNDWLGTVGKGAPDAVIIKYGENENDCMGYIEPLNNQIDDLNGIIASLNNQITELKADTVLLNNQIEELKADTVLLNNQIEELKIDTVLLNNTIKILNNQIAGLMADAASCNQNNTVLLEQITNLQSDTVLLNNTIIILKKELDDCDDAKSALEILLEECQGVGVSNVQGVSLSVYPNPVSSNGVLNIKNGLLKSGDKLEIFTMSGVLVSTHLATGVENAVNIGSLPHGTYLLRFANTNGVKFEVK